MVFCRVTIRHAFIRVNIIIITINASSIHFYLNMKRTGRPFIPFIFLYFMCKICNTACVVRRSLHEHFYILNEAFLFFFFY